MSHREWLSLPVPPPEFLSLPSSHLCLGGGIVGGTQAPRRPGLTILSPAANHSFKKIEFQPPEAKKFFSTVRKEMALLATSLPDGIMVKTFEDRMASGLLGTWGQGQVPWGTKV